MSESIPTLVIVSLLSRNFGSTDRHCVCPTVDKMLHGASIALTVTFSVALTLPPSSPLALDFGASQTASLSSPYESRCTREFSTDNLQSENLECEPVQVKPTLPNLMDDLVLTRRACTITEYRDAVNVKSSWMRRTRLTPRKRHNPLQALHNRFDDVPAVTRCDSFASQTSSEHCSVVSSRSSQDLLTPPKSNRSSSVRRRNLQRNAEWAIIE